MTTANQDLLLAFYGDDFTGSTDALEFLNRAGAKTVLFIEPPRPEQLARYPGLRAIGVAGMTRSMTPAAMERELVPAFTALRALGARHIHYKVCSTFDSSPTIGSIGKAIDIGAAIFKGAFVPLLVAAPALGRYCLFGNLFARMGTGSGAPVHRLDRHPSMSRHPVTPADESDLRLHLARQTNKQIGLMDLLQVTLPAKEAAAALETTIGNGAEIVLFDAFQESQLAGIGRLIDAYAGPGKSLFSAGSSGIEMALGSHWVREGWLQAPESPGSAGTEAPLLAVSGSCSPVTAAQIAWALQQGFAEIVLDTTAIAREGPHAAITENYIASAVSLIREGRSVIVHTGGGSAASGRINDTASLFGTALGNIMRAVTAQTSVKRMVIAGGDTSSFAARALGIEAVEMIAPLTPGAPLCRAFAPGSPADGREIVFKGGQVGQEDYFGTVMQGTTLSR
jgi:uncharacterized protein YgbK (DUF1537 family)